MHIQMYWAPGFFNWPKVVVMDSCSIHLEQRMSCNFDIKAGIFSSQTLILIQA